MIRIDQAKIEAPAFPRSQEWWRRFVPDWCIVTVQEDGTVTVEPGSEPGPGQPPKPANVIRRHREEAIFKWLYRLPQLEPAIVEWPGEPCQCWRIPAALHGGHCCFDGAKPARICHQMPKDMRGPAGEIPAPVTASL